MEAALRSARGRHHLEAGLEGVRHRFLGKDVVTGVEGSEDVGLMFAIG
jgi:hypothetical protein